MSDTGIRQFSCIRQVTDTGNILVTTAERVLGIGNIQLSLSASPYEYSITQRTEG